MNDKPPGTWPYELIAYLALAAVFAIQIVDGSSLGGMLTLGCGVMAMIARMQMGPILYLVLVAGNLLSLHNGLGPRNPFRPLWLDVSDVVTCIGVVAFVSAHYRLQGVWIHHLARDPRRGSHLALRSFRLTAEPPDPRRRAPEQITQPEITWLIISLPVWALLAQLLTHAIPQQRLTSIDIAPWLVRILLVGCTLGLGTFVVVNLLGLWKRYNMEPAAAWIFLQDTLWRETRGEQRQLQRWLAWKRLRGQK